MSLSKRTRFEVFKRDGFTCAYCGRVPPTVTLEVDHVIPRAEGGGDDLINLATSCFDCNRGKAANLLDDRAPVVNISEQTALIKEREEQLRAYHQAKESEVARRDADFTACWNYWFEVWGQDELSNVPWRSALRSSVEILGVAQVKEAMDITRDRFSWPSSKSTSYFGGIVKRKIAAVEGRVVPCTICGEDILLERGSDVTVKWHHVGCREKMEAEFLEDCPTCDGKMDAGLWYCEKCKAKDTNGDRLAALKTLAGAN